MSIEDIITKYVKPAQRDQFGLLYYYAPISTFLNGIVQDKALALWAGHVDYMEDRMEFEKGMSLIRSIDRMDAAYTKTIEISVKRRFPFQLSLSRARDCYPMWKIYGHGELSVMLILDSRVIWDKYKSISECIYEGSDEYDFIRDFIQGEEWLDSKGRPKTEDIATLLLQFPYLAKDRHYAYEQEVRIFREVRETGDKLKYKASGNIVKPFKELTFHTKALSGVMVGPCSDEEFQLTKQAILLCLVEHGFEHMQFSDSNDNERIIRSDILVRQ